MSRLGFQLEAVAAGSRARAGRFRTLHGEVLTPLFMPVGTNATVRAQRTETLSATGAQVLLANTYHLLLRPGPEVFRGVGGIHSFMKWDRGVLTDSGGYQIFSLPHGRRMTEEGAEFRSYVDGRLILLSPEKSIETQRAIGSDIMMALDECIPSTSEKAQARAAVDRTLRWARRSLAARGDSPQSLFGIVQGACYPELRRQSAEGITALPFDGFAIGGLAVGESRSEREDTTEWTAELLPADRPRYLMGVGTPLDLLEAVHRGVDMFDCILPTAHAQQGMAYTSRGRVDLRRGSHKHSQEALDPACPCETCQTHSRAYLHHLIKAREVLGWQLVGLHNLAFFHALMRSMREAILGGTFAELHARQRELLMLDDGEPAGRLPTPRAKPKSLGDYELHLTEGGYTCVRQRSSGELMHPLIEPRAEARELYVEQSGLARRASNGEASPLVLWDVGLGAATNAMEALRAWEGTEGTRALRIFSFENDLNPLRLALRHCSRFPALWHPAPGALLENGHWRCAEGRIEWRLLQGDFLETIGEAPAPGLVFYDPFSSKSDPRLWTASAFACLRERCGDEGTALFTYSSSTRVRAALLWAGFHVARGRGTGQKRETTVALTPGIISREPEWAPLLLGASWLARWERSAARLPEGLGSRDEERIRGHAQFAPGFRATEAL